jgi:replicative DNA helicase
MKLSSPIYHLKRKARLLSRAKGIPLHSSLDQIAAREGFTSWSLLAAEGSAALSAHDLFARLAPGDLVLVGARPGHGKTLLSLELAVEAMKSGRRGAFFTLEGTRTDIANSFRAIGAELTNFATLFDFDNSEAISADYIIARLASAPRGTVVVVDYLQILDQKREKPELMVQIRALRSFARDRGLIIVFISQVDRSYDPQKKSCPDLGDVRLPNPLDLTLFDKACFLHNGEVRLREARQPI